MPLTGKVVAITGASSGIGAEMARLFAASGAKVIMLARSKEKLTLLKQQFDGDVVPLYFDVTDSEMIQTTVEEWHRSHKPIDIWINNAGFARFERFQKADIASFEQMMNVNYMGVVRCTHAVLPFMLERNQGHVINIASMAGKIGTSKSTGYSATKHAVLGFTNSLRQELSDTGVKISAVNPGPVKTPFFDLADPDGEYLKNLPKWFVLTPEKVAQSVLHMIVRGKRESNIPRIGSWAVTLFLLFPGLFEKIAGKVMDRK